MNSDRNPELSIIVPVLNEAAELPTLFAALAAQRAIRFELLLCDGGSVDGTQRLASELAKKVPFLVEIIHAARGRGQQMNSGAALAKGEVLLFLHADSRFLEPQALSSAISAFWKQVAKTGSQAVAARFGLRFRRSDTSPSPAYFFYEAKARLDRADCIRGDQGCLLSRTFFAQLGGFDTSLPFYEDVMLAGQVTQQGHWMLLPTEVSTSARRFELEGFATRQVFNAIIVNSFVVGWKEFFEFLPSLYQCHANTGRLRLLPLLEGIRTRLARHDRRWRLTFWQNTGRHVAANIWQIFFWLDVRRNYRAERTQGSIGTRRLSFFQQHLEWLTRSRPAGLITAAAVWLWFRMLLIIFRLRETAPTRTS
ncbi:MAG: hypothetical protein A2X83_03430 [Desulfuromonadales bacterium GWD2_54_10]|nr:MAG: hypothetical protein A2X83_03430 [Desulfuromonadales bacterium GWD2_54_10]